MSRRIVCYGLTEAGPRRVLSRRVLAADETPDLYGAACVALAAAREVDDRWRGRMVCDPVAEVRAVQADLLAGATLVDREVVS
jgi:Na+-translocating ferredoxin:NAD+ oxidoreductase RnfG subunit